MKIPNQIKIGAHQYTVKQIESWQEGEAMAVEDSNKNEIILDSCLTQTRRESKFFHEILHVINSELDHTLLDSLAEQLYQVLKDNNLLK